MSSEFCFSVVDYTAYMADGICMRQTGVVIMCGNDAFHDSEQKRLHGGEEREEGVGRIRRGSGCVHLTYRCTVGQQVFGQRGGCRGNRASLASGSFPDALYLKPVERSASLRRGGESLVHLPFPR